MTKERERSKTRVGKMENPGYAILLIFLLIGVCRARVVSVSPVPLVRVVGQPVSLRCDVTDYEGPREQDFDWDMQPGGAGPVQVISTFDRSYPDGSLSDRVASDDIRVVRLADGAVELRIQEVRSSDSATYICKTPSTDSVISGNYEAKVQLTVIADTLSVLVEQPQPEVQQGGDISLSCTVTRQLSLPTYLSVTWAVRRGGSAPPEDILTFGPEGGVATGPGSAQRYADGGIRLVPRGGGAFGLVVSGATASDAGTYACTGREWTTEGGAWTRIAEKSADMGAVSVTPTGESLSVSALSNATLGTGDTLALSCLVSSPGLDSLGLEVAWLLDGRAVVGLGRDGVLSNGSALVGVERAAPGDFRLAVRGVGAADAGLYSCRVRAWVGSGGAGSTMAAEKTSDAVRVQVVQTEPHLTVTLTATLDPLSTGDPAELACQVTNITHLPAGGRLGVAWEHTPLPAPPGDRPAPAQTAQLIGSLDAHGNLLAGELYTDRLETGVVALTRVTPDTFKLRFLRTQEVDMGLYACRVTVWSVPRQGELERAAENQSPAVTVRWEPKRPTLMVVAKRIREASTGGATFEMSCSVSHEHLQEPGYSVLVQSQEKVGAAARTLLSLSPDAVLQHGGAIDPNRRDSLVLSKTGPSEFRFRLAGVQLADRGFYWCDITAWSKQPGEAWTRAANAESNKVQINFQEAGPSFEVAVHSDTTSVFPWETVKMECTLSVSGASPKTDDVSYEVSWYLTRLRGAAASTLLARMDRFGVVREGVRNSSSDVSLERRDAHAYALRVHAAQDGDAGEYHCQATPWYLLASTGAWTQGAELTSARVFLNVRFAMWDSLKLPLLYGAGASAAVGLFSVVLGLVCAHCCCRNAASHTPRSRNKLMMDHLEMD